MIKTSEYRENNQDEIITIYVITYNIQYTITSIVHNTIVYQNSFARFDFPYNIM